MRSTGPLLVTLTAKTNERLLPVTNITSCLSTDSVCYVEQGNSPQAKAVAAALSDKLHQLEGILQEGLVSQVDTQMRGGGC